MSSDAYDFLVVTRMYVVAAFRSSTLQEDALSTVSSALAGAAGLVREVTFTRVYEYPQASPHHADNLCTGFVSHRDM